MISVVISLFILCLIQLVVIVRLQYNYNKVHYYAKELIKLNEEKSEMLSNQFEITKQYQKWATELLEKAKNNGE